MSKATYKKTINLNLTATVTVRIRVHNHSGKEHGRKEAGMALRARSLRYNHERERGN